MRYIIYIIFILTSLLYGEEELLYINDVPENIMEGQYLLSELKLLEAGISLSLLDVCPVVGTYGAAEPSLLSVTDTRKNPVVNGEYYTINGNKDIVILGYNKQQLYNNATYTWTEEASYTLPVSNVGCLTYGDITLNDISALQTGTDYSEFIYNVQINGFSSNYEYRLELNNGNVILWSKLPGEDPSPTVPEPSSFLISVLGLITLAAKRKRV